MTVERLPLTSGDRPVDLPAGLAPQQLRRTCDPQTLGFATTEELEDLQAILGQPRALSALELGSQVSGPGYNIFVLGLPSSGRTTLTLEYLRRQAIEQPVPADWCYVNNFEDVRQPHALRMPSGQARALRKDITELVTFCEQEFPRVFQSAEYLKERERLVDQLSSSHETEFERLQEYVARYNFVIARTPFGLVLAPSAGGEPLKPEDLEKLSEEQRAKLEQLQNRLKAEVDRTLNKMREMTRQTFSQLHELNTRTALFTIEPSFTALQQQYAALPEVSAYLQALQADIVQHANQFQPPDASEGAPDGSSGPDPWTERYDVNVLIDHSETQGAPVIYESHPSYYNLLGRIEHEVMMGASRTDFRMIRAGALHRANGGYLVLPARDLLINPYAWDGLKRSLRDGELRIDDLGSQLGLISTKTLEPEPIPLKIKVVLVGTPLLYYLLSTYDEDFSKLFKVRAEFTGRMERSLETEREFAYFVRSVVDANRLPHFEAPAVARLVELSSRLAEDQQQLSTRFGLITDRIREAAFFAQRRAQASAAGAGPALAVTAADVEQAIAEHIYRNNLLEERIQELIAQNTLMISVSGWATGQVNALSVILLGDYAFGRPSRLSASVYPGRSGVVDIEREAELGGPIHTKGVLIISGFLGQRYGQRRPLSLSASLTFEQSYEGVEGDSASAAELFALLSALADLPLRQDLAITGSVNQHGQVQAVGGVNQKVEGFFAACQAGGLSGTQGVLIPAANVRHLMLHSEVVAAVAAGQFHLYPIRTVDEGLALLSGVQPGSPDADGEYPAGCFNRAVAERLDAFAELMSQNRPNNLPK